LSTAAGSLALAVGTGVQIWMHGAFAHFASGFLLGVSIALLILGFGHPSRDLPGRRQADRASR
jgi:hypothetical protein